jgi:MoxR-like ATPase
LESVAVSAQSDRVHRIGRAVFRWTGDDAAVAEVDVPLGSGYSSSSSGSSSGSMPLDAGSSLARFTPTAPLRRLLAGMVQSHAVGRDLLLCGPEGSGKSAAAGEFCRLLGYTPRLLSLYADMTARDLFQRRATDPATGDTTWVDSALVTAAKEGSVIILDAAGSVSGDTLAALSPLLLDRDAVLPSGVRLLRWDRYDAAVAAGARTEALARVHPSFRVIAIATGKDFFGWSMAAAETLGCVDKALLPSSAAASASASTGGAQGGSAASAAAPPFLHPEVRPLFDFHVIPRHHAADIKSLLAAALPAGPTKMFSALANLVETLYDLADTTFASDSATAPFLRISLRQVVRLATHCTHAQSLLNGKTDNAAAALHPAFGLPYALVNHVTQEIKESLFTAMLPANARAAMESALKTHGFEITPTAIPNSRAPSATKIGASARETIANVGIEIIADNTVPSGKVLRVGDDALSVSAPVRLPMHPEYVPRSHPFFDIPSHIAHLRDLLLDCTTGDHILLFGPQGSGKNKVVDRLLELLAWEREYIQLHRDSSVTSLTVLPKVQDGKVIWEDSPLVRAAKEGRALVVDEIDKAPTEVVAVLKGLVADGQMTLSDGRTLIDPSRCPYQASGENIIPVHPDFRIFALANRPGWPFLGNSIFSTGLASVFATHFIGNSDRASSLQLVTQYAPSAHNVVLMALVDSFEALRDLQASGTITYPYSTRELVAIAKHLEAYPHDGLVGAVRNVLSFDAFESHTRTLLLDCFRKNGIMLPDALVTEADHCGRVAVASDVPLVANGFVSTTVEASIAGLLQSTSLRLSGWRYVPDEDVLSKSQARFPLLSLRSSEFREEKAMWTVLSDSAAERMQKNQFVSSSCHHNNGSVFVVSNAPATLHCFRKFSPNRNDSWLLADVLGIRDEREYVAFDLRRANQLPVSLGGLMDSRRKQAAVKLSHALLDGTSSTGGATNPLGLAGAWFGGRTASASSNESDALDVSSIPSVCALGSSEKIVLLSPSSDSFIVMQPFVTNECTVFPLPALPLATPLAASSQTQTDAPINKAASFSSFLDNAEAKRQIIMEQNAQKATETFADTAYAGASWMSAPADARREERPLAKQDRLALQWTSGRGAWQCVGFPSNGGDSVLLWRVGGGAYAHVNLNSGDTHAYLLPHDVLSNGGSAALRPLGISDFVVEDCLGKRHLFKVLASGEMSYTGKLDLRSSSPTSIAGRFVLPSDTAVSNGAGMVSTAIAPGGCITLPAPKQMGENEHLTILAPADSTPGLGGDSESSLVTLAVTDTNGRYACAIELSNTLSAQLIVFDRLACSARLVSLLSSGSGLQTIVGAHISNDNLVIVEGSGTVRLVQIGASKLSEERAIWESAVGTQPNSCAWTIDVVAESDAEASRAENRLLGVDGDSGFSIDSSMSGSSSASAGSAKSRSRVRGNLIEVHVKRPEPKSGSEKKSLGADEKSKAPPALTSPKHGQADDGKQHVGGSNWAGGTGGSNTAGMGGRGGPYRLLGKGVKEIHQVSDELKAQVSEEARQKAHAMAKEAYDARLREIGMSGRQATAYLDVVARVSKEIGQLRGILSGAKLSSSERVWLKNQSVGDLDDSKLVDGISGDRQVYKRRASQDDNALGIQEPKPRILTFCLDASASLYRFNGNDQRLDRTLECAALIMESFAGFENAFRISIVGHSGDSDKIPLVDFGSLPQNASERLKVLETIVANTQYTSSGDHTLEGAARAVRDTVAEVQEGRGSEGYVFLVSDANFHRYGIRPVDIARSLSPPAFAVDVPLKAYAMLISPGLSGDETNEIVEAMPGKAFSVLDTAAMPGIFRSLFTAHFAVKY